MRKMKLAKDFSLNMLPGMLQIKRMMLLKASAYSKSDFWGQTTQEHNLI